MKYIDHGEGIVEVEAPGVIVSEASDILDLLANTQAEALIVRKANLNQDFFVLSSGFAGEMLQKISNYHKRLAIIGDYSSVTSKALRDFIYESNKNRQVLFVDSVEAALGLFGRRRD